MLVKLLLKPQRIPSLWFFRHSFIGKFFQFDDIPTNYPLIRQIGVGNDRLVEKSSNKSKKQSLWTIKNYIMFIDTILHLLYNEIESVIKT